MEALPIKNLNRPEPNILTAGQPTPAELEALAKVGLKHVVNLRPQAEQADFDQAAFVENLGLRYHAIPVDGPAGLTTENAARLAKVLEAIGDEPALVHCSSSNRVGGLIAIQEFRSADADIEAAIERGRAWGLKRLELLVREQLAANTTSASPAN